MITRLTILLLLVAPAASVLAQNAGDMLDPDRTQLSRTDLSRQVDIAIRKGVKYILSRQNTDGSWANGNATDEEGGRTALSALALLSSGESHQATPVDRAIKFLKRARPERAWHATYSIGLRAAVYASIPEPLRKQELVNDTRWLQQNILKSNGRKGMYDYGNSMSRGGDYSNSQYGALGVWYAAQAGVEVPSAYWKQVEDGWLMGQHEDGGWGYRPERPDSYASMTAAAVATLFITSDYLRAKDARDLNVPVTNKPLDAGMAWLGKNFSPSENTGRAQRPGAGQGNQDLLDLLGEIGREEGYQIFYMLFGFERVGEASGMTRFGNHKWYDEGAEYLIKTQQYDGSWSGSNGPEVDTAYALLFLSRGRAPVVAQKLEFDGRWNNRPRDMAAFTRFMRRASERHVNWQIVTLNHTPAELRESPLLYAVSDKAPTLDADQKAKLKAYIDQGGLLACVQEGAGDEFARSIIALAAELYPAYKFRDLPDNHPVYSFNFPSNRVADPIKALSNGIRELIVLYPSGDASWKWQSAAGGFLPKNSPYATLANLWLYVTDRANPRFKGEDTWIVSNPGVQAERKARVVRIRHGGNWDPEPGGWERMANIMHNFDQCDLQTEIFPPVPVAPASPSGDARPATRPSLDLSSFHVAHITDTKTVSLVPGMKTVLKRYIDGGGMLLLDAAGGSPEAGGSFEVLMRELYPNVAIVPLPLDHPIYHATGFGGQEIQRVNYRRSTDTQTIRIPKLKAVMLDKKLIAVISYEDLSAGLVGYSTAGVTGYTSASAVDLVRNIILWRSSALR